MLEKGKIYSVRGRKMYYLGEGIYPSDTETFAARITDPRLGKGIMVINVPEENMEINEGRIKIKKDSAVTSISYDPEQAHSKEHGRLPHKGSYTDLNEILTKVEKGKKIPDKLNLYK
jgi:hypothetical protein